MKRLILSFILTVSLLANSISLTYATKSTGPVVNAKQYEAFLTEKGKADSESLKIRTQFQNLTSEKKNKFLNYISNPKIIEEVMDTYVPENSSIKLHNGDIIIRNIVKSEIVPEKFDPVNSLLNNFFGNAYAADKIENMYVEDKREVCAFGILSLTFKTWVSYKAKNKKTIVSITGGNGSCTHHLIVGSVEKVEVSTFIMANKAVCKATWRQYIDLGLSKLGMSMNVKQDVWTHRVIGMPNGSVDYSCARGL